MNTNISIVDVTYEDTKIGINQMSVELSSIGYSVESIIIDNSPPIADAGFDVTASVGSKIILDGSLSADPDNDKLTYQWLQVAGPEGADL